MFISHNKFISRLFIIIFHLSSLIIREINLYLLCTQSNNITHCEVNLIQYITCDIQFKELTLKIQ